MSVNDSTVKSRADLSSGYNRESGDSLDQDLTGELESKSKRWTWPERLLLALIIFPPFAFGAVHPRVFLSLEAVVFFASAIVAFGYLANRYQIKIPKARFIVVVSSGLLGLLGYQIVQQIGLGLLSQPHPVLTESSSGPSTLAFFASFRTQIFNVILILGALVLAFNRKGFSRQIFQTCIFVGLLVALTAIAHWFYDNGKLFWVFEPDFVGVSPRARWPFVNPNHLAIYLLPIFFLALGEFLRVISATSDLFAKNQSIKFVRLIQHPSVQHQLLASIYYFSAAFCMAVATAAAQSRGAWFGLSVGIVLLALLAPQRSSLEANKIESASVIQMRSEQSRSRRRRHRSIDSEARLFSHLGRVLARYWRALLFVGAIALLVVFLNETGRDLVAGRIEFGLKHSLDDIRFAFFADSLRMFLDAPFFGFGLGGWAPNYPRYMSLELSSLNPVYLHSDPFQYLIELGIFGFLTVLGVTVIILTAVVRVVRLPKLPTFGDKAHEFARNQHKARFGAIGVLSLCTASFFDFPFRVPAIAILFCVLVGITLFCVSRVISISDSAE